MARVALADVRRFCIDCMTAVGTPQANATALADVLVEADNRGHYSHGINRLEMYVRDVKLKTCDGSAVPSILSESPATAWVDGNSLGEMYVRDVKLKTCDGSAVPSILSESPATAWVDGNNSLGPVVGNFCMEVAINKAKECGVGWVVAKGSNHYGIAGWYSMLALKHNMLGMSFTNTSPLMSPTRSKKSALGTNPISLSAPGENGDSFVLDMATTAVAVGKIEVQRRKKEPIPVGWAQGPDGQPTTDAELAFKTSALMPLGGEEKTSGYKGYGLALLVETFCGILAGADYGPKIRKWMDGERPANLGQCFIAINPSCFAPGFELRMSDMMGLLRNLEPADPEKPVLVHGDPERRNMEKVNSEGGVLYHENQLKASAQLAAELKSILLSPVATAMGNKMKQWISRTETAAN